MSKQVIKLGHTLLRDTYPQDNLKRTLYKGQNPDNSLIHPMPELTWTIH